MNNRMYFLLGIFLSSAALLQAQTLDGEYGIIEWSESTILSVSDYITGDGTNPLELGGDGTPTKATDGDDVYIKGILEVDTIAYFDNGFASLGTVRVWDNMRLLIGAVDADGGLAHFTANTPDTLSIWTGDESNYIKLTSNADKAVDIGLAQQANPTLIITSQGIDSDQTEYLSLSHDGTYGVISSGKGSLSLKGSTYFETSAVLGDDKAVFFGRLNVQSMMIRGSRTKAQGGLFVGTDVGRQLVFSDSINYTKDHDHATPTNPTLFIHSATDPDTDNTQWLSLSHDGTNGVIDVGSGSIHTTDYLEMKGGARFWATTTLKNGLYLLLGDGGANAAPSLFFDTPETVDSLTLHTGTTSNRLIVKSAADRETDTTLPQASDPTITLMSNTFDSDVTEYGSISHDGSDFVVDTGKGNVKFEDGLRVPFGNANSATYTINLTDQIVGVSYTATGAVTVTIDSDNTKAGRYFTIKDTGGSAGSNNITIATEGAETIDGAATATISTNYDSLIIFSDGTNYFKVE
jgi:hypothetical protein